MELVDKVEEAGRRKENQAQEHEQEVRVRGLHGRRNASALDADDGGSRAGPSAGHATGRRRQPGAFGEQHPAAEHGQEATAEPRDVGKHLHEVVYWRFQPRSCRGRG